MTKGEYEDILYTDIPESIIKASDLVNQSDRILILGYTKERDEFITELWAGSIHTSIVDFFTKEEIPVDVTTNSDYIPNKRVCPNKSDYEFCQLLSAKGISIPFTKFPEDDK